MRLLDAMPEEQADFNENRTESRIDFEGRPRGVRVVAGACGCTVAKGAALRIRVLSDVAEANDKLTLTQLLRRYNGREILGAGLRRLLEKRQRILRNGRYFIRNRFLLRVARLLNLVKLALLGKGRGAPSPRGGPCQCSFESNANVEAGDRWMRTTDPGWSWIGWALWGVCAAAAFSAGCTWVFLLQYQPSSTPPAEFVTEALGAYTNELPEKVFFAAWFASATLASYLAVRYREGLARQGALPWLSAVLYVPLGCRWMQSIFQRDGKWWNSVFCLLCIGLPWLCCAVRRLWTQFSKKPLPQGPGDNAGRVGEIAGRFPPTEAVASGWVRRAFVTIGPLVVFGLMIVPSSVREVASRHVGENHHLVSYFSGPALYAYGKGLVPGKDYFTQYGIGHAYVFSFVLGQDARHTLEHYVVFAALVIWSFFGVSYWVLRDFFHSAAWAFGTSLTALLLVFHTERSFWDPSSWPLRYPLLFAFVWAWVRGCGAAAAFKWQALAGLLAGLSMFWNTEPGVYMIVCGCTGFILLGRFKAAAWTGAARMAVAVVLAFLLPSLAAYGRGVFSWRFGVELFKPFLIYGGGFGAWPVNWLPGWSYLFVALIPGLALACVGGCWAIPQKSREQAYLYLVAALGICLFLKWVNMSINAVWLVNAFPFVAVTSWWLQKAAERLARLPASELHQQFVKWGAGIAVAVAAGWFVWVVDDSRNPALYGARAFWAYPSAFKGLVAGPVKSDWPPGVGQVPGEDVALIQRLTSPGERVALISYRDWVYLNGAKRPPKFWFVPSVLSFLNWQIEKSLQDADLVFVETSEGKWVLSESVTLGRRLKGLLAMGYEVAAVGPTLTAYRKTRSR